MSTKTNVTITDLKDILGDVVDDRTSDTRDLAIFLSGITSDEDGDTLDHVTDIDAPQDKWDTGTASIWRIAIDGLVLYHHQDDGQPMSTTVYDKDPGIRKYLKGWDRPEGGYGALFSEWGA